MKLNWNLPKSLIDKRVWRGAEQTPTRFLSGLYQNKNIGEIVKSDPNYIAWILDNQPKSKLAFQIIEYYNHYGF
jgi:hypothetical protein